MKKQDHNSVENNYYLLTGCEGCSIGNTSPRFFIQPELAKAVWKTKGLYLMVQHEHPVSK